VARPDTNDGFLMVALELFPALMLADFRHYEMVVLVWVLGPSFGPKKKPWHKLDASEVGRMTNIDPNNVRRAVRSLIERKVLIRNAEDLIKFNKNFDAWEPGVKPAGRKMIKAALSLWRTSTSDQHLPESRQTRNGSIQTSLVEPETGLPRPETGLPRPVLLNPSRIVPPRPPLEESRASERKEEEKKEKKYPPNPPKGGRVGVIPFSQRDRTRVTAADRRRAKLDETLNLLQAEHDALTPEELEAERQQEIEAVRNRFGQAGVDRYLADEAREREAQRVNGGSHGGR